jgi:hypothetical protein
MKVLAALLCIVSLSSSAPGQDSPWSPDALELVAAARRDALASALDDAGANAPELVAALEALEGERREAALQLIEGMPHLDRLEMKAATLVEHVELAFEAGAGQPDSLFEPYVLTYRIDQEPVEAWRGPLHKRWSGDTPESVARAINAGIAAGIVERDRGFFGPVQPPLFTLSAGSGTETEIAVLATAALRAAGIPARRVRVPAMGEQEGSFSWIEFHDGASWRPMYPLEPGAFGDEGRVERGAQRNVTIVEASSGFGTALVTGRYTPTAVLDLLFLSNGEPAGGFEHFSVSVLNDGALVPLDALEAVTDERGRFAATLGDGRYIVAAGVRDAEGDPLVKMLEVDLEPDERREIVLDVSPDQTPARDAVPVVAWVVCDPSREPDARMLPLVASALAVRGAAVTYVTLGSAGAVEATRALVGRSARVIRADDLPDDAPLRGPFGPGTDTPVIELYEAGTMRAILRHTGFDLNVARVVESAGARAHTDTEEGR